MPGIKDVRAGVTIVLDWTRWGRRKNYLYMQRSLNWIWCRVGAICILHLCRWSGSALSPSPLLQELSSGRILISGLFHKVWVFKPDVTLHRIFLKPVISSWAVLGTEPKPEVKGNVRASSPEAVSTWVSIQWHKTQWQWCVPVPWWIYCYTPK